MNHPSTDPEPFTAVGTVDGTSTTNNTYSYPCLNVEPNSQIYFYQFTSPSSTTTLWTTRFTIADSSGKTVPPELQETSATGEIIRYGIGKLEDPSLVDTPPARGSNTGVTSPSASVNGTNTSAGISTAAPSGAATPTATLTRNVSTDDGSDDNNNTQPAAVSSAAVQPSQTQKAGAVSYQRPAGVSILAGAILCGSMLL